MRCSAPGEHKETIFLLRSLRPLAVEKGLFTEKERMEYKEMLFLLRSMRPLAVEKGLFTAKDHREHKEMLFFCDLCGLSRYKESR